jgi:hypothetical protein
LKSPRNATGIDMTNLHRSPPMNQSKTDLGIVNESQLPRHGISADIFTGIQHNGLEFCYLLRNPGFQRAANIAVTLLVKKRPRVGALSLCRTN